jgi:hypothetical protein
MLLRLGSVLLVAVLTAAPAGAQSGWRFRWQPGQVLTYRVTHDTTVAETADGGTVETVARLALVKRWRVTAVDAAGVATVQFSLAALRNEQKRPDGETLLYDSRDPDKSTPELREQMAKFVGPTLAVLRVDPAGKVIEVKQGSAERYDAEPPFAVVFPRADAEPAVGQQWARPYTVVLAPPQGTGEKVGATQTYHCVKLDGGRATIDVKTAFKNPPEAAQDRLPLLQKDVAGQVVFDVAAGQLVAARFAIDRTVENHQGPGSSYRFRSRYVEELAPAGE